MSQSTCTTRPVFGSTVSDEQALRGGIAYIAGTEHPLARQQAVALFPSPVPTPEMNRALYAAQRFTPKMRALWDAHKAAELAQSDKRAAWLSGRTPGCCAAAIAITDDLGPRLGWGKPTLVVRTK